MPCELPSIVQDAQPDSTFICDLENLRLRLIVIARNDTMLLLIFINDNAPHTNKLNKSVAKDKEECHNAQKAQDD